MNDSTLVLCGGYSSPYSMKMRAVLRYRHIPHRWVLRNSKWDDLPTPPVPVIPVLAWPDEEGGYSDVMVDSSPQITRLEAEYKGRSIIPNDQALAFIDFLLEDFADEWITKIMYHYRWAYEADIEKAGQLLPLDQNLQLPEAIHTKAHDFIIERQIGRRAMVGSTDSNTHILENSYINTLDILEQHFQSQDFLFGERPGRVDFALYGQLKPLLWQDPTPMAIAVERAPRVMNWIQRVDDLSWWEVNGDEGWTALESCEETVSKLLHEAGSTYTPFIIANNEALQSGTDEMICDINGSEYRQAPFKYQAKCLQWIREAYNNLSSADQSRVHAYLAGTGCENLFK